MPYTTDDARWAAVVARDRGADGAFLFGVITTGIYCRPGCSSRTPRRDHVRYFTTPEAAEEAGLRPCKRCLPRGGERPQAEAVARACALIEAAPELPTLRELADAAGLSPFHFHRVFKATTGVTPAEYGRARREERLRQSLRAADSVTEAIFAAGYGSTSAAYGSSAPLGMTPGAYRAGAEGEHIRYAVADSYLGPVLVAATTRGICAIEFGESAEQLQARLVARFPNAALASGDTTFDETVARVLALIEAPAQGLDLPLDIQGTAFQRRVWAALRTIPAGHTASYSEVAARIGQPGAARAVAQACAANRLAVAVPCHRVVRGDGDLSGYRWGTARKQALLEREAASSLAGDHS